MTFVHLHSHSYYSLMDGFNSPEELILRAKELGQPAMAVTDHGGLSAHREFQQAGLKHGVKPILGVEAYISPTDRFDKSSGTDKSVLAYHHVILLAMNDAGLKNIMRLSEIAWTEGYYFKPRIDQEVLEQYNEGIIVLSGCMSGLIAKNLLRDEPAAAERWARWFVKVFGDRFYMELQFHNEPGLNDKMIRIANKYNIELVATADCHFARPAERAAEEAMLILSTSPKKNKDFDFAKSRAIKDPFERLNYIYPERPISFEHIDVYVSSREELEAGFEKSGLAFRSDLYDNTLKIADRIESYTYHEAEDLLPRPKNRDPYLILEARARQGMDLMGYTGKPEYEERFAYEMEAIRVKGMESYFLIVGETIEWTKNQGIRVGPGRGSGAGSLIAMVTGITTPDPIKENLLFARFVNPGYVNTYAPRFEVVK